MSELQEIATSLWERDCRTLEWSSEPLSQKAPWTSGWADIYVPQICEPLEMNWLVTMLPHKEPESMLLPYDSHLLLAEEPLLVRPGHDPLPVEDPGDVFHREEWLCEEGYRVPVWSMDFLGRATANWLLEETGYRFEMVFSSEARAPIFEEASDTLQRVQDGEEETFDLGDGIFVSSSAMDELLRDPEMAARVLRELKRQ